MKSRGGGQPLPPINKVSHEDSRFSLTGSVQFGFPSRETSFVINSASQPKYGYDDSGRNLPTWRMRSAGGGMSQAEQEARMLLMQSNPELFERRKMLAQAAFVKHNTAELMDNLRYAAQAHEAGDAADGPSPPVSPYTRDRAVARSQLDVSSVPQTPIALKTSTTEFEPRVPGTLNGIGHPLLNDEALLASSEEAVLTLDVPGHAHHHQHRGHHHRQPGGSSPRIKLAPLHQHQQPGAGPPGRGSGSPTKALDGEPSAATVTSTATGRELLSRADLMTASLDFSARMQRPDPLQQKKPLSQDTLNLWNGKRLNRVEMKVEQRLHRLRNNPTAKSELQTRVDEYLEAKTGEMEELSAQQLLASERREQKALTFLERQSRYKPKNAAGPHAKSVRAASPARKPVVVQGTVAALFDPLTGAPLDDGAPLPEASRPWWAGFAMLTRSVLAIRGQVLLGAEKRAAVAKEGEAAVLIQKHWKGFLARKTTAAMRQQALQLKKMATTMARDPDMRSAAGTILTFLSDLAKAGKQGEAQAALKATAKRTKGAKSAQDFLKSARVAMLLRQWTAVEAAAIAVSKKRTHGAAVLGVATGQKKKENPLTSALQARKKGLLPQFKYGDEQAEAIKSATEEALSKVFVNDRIVSEDCQPVPTAVKAAIINGHMAHKKQAYYALIGLTWRMRAQYKKDKRREDAKQVALDMVTTHEEDEEEEGEEGEAGAAPAQGADAAAAAGGEASAADGQVPTPPPRPARQSTTGRKFIPANPRAPPNTKPGRRPPMLAPFRVLCTPVEMKALMQQGVQEAPIFNAYMLKGQLTEYEQKLTKDLVNRFNTADEKEKKMMARMSRHTGGGNLARMDKDGSLPGKGGHGAPSPVAGKPGSTADDISDSLHHSWTVALLMHRWRAEAVPRTAACLTKRYGLLKVDLVDCLATAKHFPAEEMGHTLMGLVAGP